MEISSDRVVPIDETESGGIEIDNSRIVPLDGSQEIKTSGPSKILNDRGLNLGTRATIEGVASLPLMVGDALNAAINLPIKGLNKLTKAGIPVLIFYIFEFKPVLIFESLFFHKDFKTFTLLKPFRVTVC